MKIMLLIFVQIVYAVLLSAILIWVGYRLYVTFTMFRIREGSSKFLGLEDVPTVSVCIPVRNEAGVIEEALERVLASDYPKLEVIVSDDESVDNTSEEVKLLAHKGVRFIPAGKTPTGWLGKTHALDELYRQASGDYILFLSADTRIAPQTISKLVSYALSEEAQMVSVLPMRDDSPRASVFFGTLRYFLELLLHSPFDPAFSTACWMIERDFLRQVDGFSAYKDSFVAEAKLAQAVQSFRRYRFLASNLVLGISYRKKWRSQIQTSVRSNYYIMKNVPFAGAVYGGLVMMWSGPLVALIVLLFNPQSIFGWLITGLASLGGVLYATFCSFAWNKYSLIGFVTWPIVVAQELITMLASTYLHKYRKPIIWKGRDVSQTAAISQG